MSARKVIDSFVPTMKMKRGTIGVNITMRNILKIFELVAWRGKEQVEGAGDQPTMWNYSTLNA